MTLEKQAAAFFQSRPELTFGILGPRDNLTHAPRSVLGIPVEQFATEDNPHLAQQYLATNQFSFGMLALPRWVLSDLYLMPGFIGVLMCEARHVNADLRNHLGVREDQRVIGAAYVAAPTIRPGQFVGVSLLSVLQERKAGAWVKTLTLKLHGAKLLRGVAQWDNLSLRVHTRLGPMRLVGRPPGGHEYSDRTFVYETSLDDDAAWADAMARKPDGKKVRRVPARNTAELSKLVDRAMAGESIYIASPGLEAGEVLIRE